MTFMNTEYYILIIGESFDDHKRIDPYDELKKRLDKNFWYLYKKTKHAEKMKSKDLVLFYVSGINNQKIFGKAIINKKEKVTKLKHNTYASNTPIYCLNFNQITYFSEPKKMSEVILNTSFFKDSPKKNIKKWGVFLMGGVKKISRSDFKYLSSNQ